MQAIVFDHPGDAHVLTLGHAPSPTLAAPHDVHIRIHAAGVNRADIMQRNGKYAPPAGASNILGLECAGESLLAGLRSSSSAPANTSWPCCPAAATPRQRWWTPGSVLPLPKGWSMLEGAAFMETYATAFLTIFRLGEVQPHHRVLIHGGASGIGTSAIALCKQENITTFVTAGNDEKCQKCVEHGATHAINYRTHRFAESIASLTHGEGVDVILDCIGGTYLADNLACLRQDGCLVIIGLMGGTSGTADLGLVLRKRLRIIGSTLRSRSNAYKAQLVHALQQRFGAAMAAGGLKPVIDQVFPLADAKEAHERMQASTHFGKLVLKVDRP